MLEIRGAGSMRPRKGYIGTIRPSRNASPEHRRADTVIGCVTLLVILLFNVPMAWAQGERIGLPGGGTFLYRDVRVLHEEYRNVVVGEMVNATGRRFTSVEFSVNIHGRYGIPVAKELLVIEGFADGETRSFAVPTGVDIGQIRNISITLAEGN